VTRGAFGLEPGSPYTAASPLFTAGDFAQARMTGGV
jgi:hypothetical protein